MHTYFLEYDLHDPALTTILNILESFYRSTSFLYLYVVQGIVFSMVLWAPTVSKGVDLVKPY